MADLALYAVRNEKGQFLRSKGYPGKGSTWVDTLEEAKIYGKPGPAKARITWFKNVFPKFETLELVKLHVERIEVLDQKARVQKVRETAARKRLSQARAITERRIEDLKREQARIERELQNITSRP